MAVSKFSEIDEYGFKRPADFDYEYYERIMTVYYAVLTSRALRWEKFLRKHDILDGGNTLKRYIRKGIPSSMRPEVWLKSSSAFLHRQRQPDLYQKLLKCTYDKETADQIRVDLPRTFPENIYFDQYKSSLFNVLITYSLNNKDVGYCQGLNYIAGLLLLVTKNEEHSFWLLKEVVENIVPSYHTKSMYGLITDVEVLAQLIRQRSPEIHKHIKQVGLPWEVILTKWFICIFAEVLPVETVLRIWDCIFAEGFKILFRVSVTIILRNRSEILKTHDMSELLNVFRRAIKGPQVLDTHQFLKSIFTIPGRLKRNDIEKLRTQINKARLKDKVA
ncbi:growth hormone-regulated TBC protein 1-A [Culicoides brevitarsis]|uniref:growth hormone-regulated TBC protein 1-A n=1 Tax=Culicoides brevitarsis TaxID=469753 RepID=UPI00307C4572